MGTDVVLTGAKYTVEGFRNGTDSADILHEDGLNGILDGLMAGLPRDH